MAPLAVLLNAQSSEAGEGAVTNFEWDLEGDGTYDASGPGWTRCSGSTTTTACTTRGCASPNCPRQGYGKCDGDRQRSLGSHLGIGSGNSISDVVADADGKLYAVGITRRLGGTGDGSVLLLRISPEGSLDWVRMWDNLTDEYAYAVELSADNTVVVTGTYHDTDGGGYEVFIQKWLKNGNLSWCRRYGGPGHDMATALVVDGYDLYLGGRTTSSSSDSIDAFLMPVHPDGIPGWLQLRDSGDNDVVSAMCFKGDPLSGESGRSPPAPPTTLLANTASGCCSTPLAADLSTAGNWVLPPGMPKRRLSSTGTIR